MPSSARIPRHCVKVLASLCHLVCLLGGAHLDLGAQRLPVGDAWEEYLRVLQAVGLAGGGSLTVRPLSWGYSLGTLNPGAEHPWALRVSPPSRTDLSGNVSISFAHPSLEIFVNSAYADGQNDGAVWQGKGLSTALEAGSTLSVGPLNLTVNPVLLYSQNASFELAPLNLPDMPVYGYPWRWIDLPQRFGPDASDPVGLRELLGTPRRGSRFGGIWYGEPLVGTGGP